MRKGRPASPHAGLLLRPPDPQKLSELYQLTPSFPIGRFSFHSRQGEKKGGGGASSDSQIIAWQISKCTFHGSEAVRALPLAVCVIILEGAHDLNILKLINASRISHSLKGPLESRTAECIINQRQWTRRFRVPLGVWATLAGILPCQLGRRHK